MAAVAPMDADAAALPDGSSCCVEAALSLSPAHPPSPPILPSSPSSAQLPRSDSLRPASTQPAAATVAACLLHSLSISPVFCLSSLLLSSSLSSGL